MQKRKDNPSRLAFDQIIGVKMRIAREVSGVSREDMSIYLEITQSLLSRLENGKTSASLWQVYLYCSRCGIPMTAIIKQVES